MSQERESHNSFEKSATFYLEAAHMALLNGQPRLAIHLYRAAFEVESTYGTIISSAVIEGLRKAWDLACELSDRSIAESLFSDLSTYNSHEQNEQASMRLQTLALNQLEDMGVTENDLESIATAISHELMSSDHENLFDSLKSMLEQLGLTPVDEDGGDFQAIREALPELPEIQGLPEIQRLPGIPGLPALPAASSPFDSDTKSPKVARPGDAKPSDAKPDGAKPTDIKPGSARPELPVPTQKGLAKIDQQLREFRNRKNETVAPGRQLNYETLAGYQNAMERMREFGFVSQADERERSFVERAAVMHGVSKLSLDDTFLFIGSSRDDTFLFAQATAGEINIPVFHVSIDLDSQGNGTIKLIGPFKRGFFGAPPDIMDMATPCVVLIENLDYLQKMFNNEQIAIQRHGGKLRSMMPGGPGMGRSMQAEVSGYLWALHQRPGVVTMATAQSIDGLKEPLLSMLSPLNRIEILPPSHDERHDILCTFAAEHPSFAELDLERIAHLSEGISRSELVRASHTAVEEAYRESLRTGSYQKVALGGVMVQFAPYIKHNSPLYEQIEDEAVAQFSLDLEEGDITA